MQRIFSFLTGALCGAAFGAVTALLLTPMSGQEAKTQSRLRAEELAAEVRRAYTDKQAELKAQLEALKGQSASE